MNVVSSLKFSAYSRVPEENKQGFLIYDGNAKEFHTWCFRTRLKLASVLAQCDDDADERAKAAKKLAAMVTEVLRGDALQVAMHIGEEDLLKDTGVDTLITKMRDSVLPMVQERALDLCREGHKSHGTLTRQHGESTHGYITRRERWWALLKEMDPKLGLSDSMLTQLMMDGAGITDSQKLLIPTSVNNEITFKG